MKLINVIKLFSENRGVYEEKGGYIRSLPNIDRDVKLLVNLVHKYYDEYPDHKYIGKEEMHNFYDVCYPGARDAEEYHMAIDNLHDAKVSTDIMSDILEQAVEMHFAQLIATKLVPAMNGTKFGIIPNIKADVEQFVSYMKRPPKDSTALQPNMMLPSELIAEALSYEGPEWVLEELTMTLGPVQTQTLGSIFGSVNSGKTSLCMAQIAKVADYYRDTGETIVFAGNEEPSRRTKKLMSLAFLNKTQYEIDAMGKEADEYAAMHGWHRVKLVDSVKHISQVIKILDEWGPKYLVIDQGAKVQHDIQAKDNDKLRVLYNFYRDLANEYDCAITTVEQGTGEIRYRQWVDMVDIYNSRVGIQGELDYAIGIGQVDKPGRENYRYLNISKNKLLDGFEGRTAAKFDHTRCLWTPA